MAKGWLDNYGEEDNYNDSQASAPEGFQGDGYSNVGRNYSPAWGGQFQTGGYLKKKFSNTEKELLKEYIDPVKERASRRAQQQGINTGSHNGGLDAIRHSSSAAAMSSALPGWTNFIPGVAPLKIIGTNIAGAAHELNAPNSWKEHGSDLYNNFIGSIVGTLPISEENQHDLLIKAQKHGVLSDMGDRKPLRKKPAALKQQMGGSVYPVNYVPQAQNGKKNNKKKNIQDKVEDWLDHPMQKAEQAADEYTDPGEDQTDNIRHPMAGRFTSEAIQNKFPSWMQYIGIPQAAGFLGGSAAGLGHELIEPNRGTVKRPYSMWDTIKEGAEDQLNNMVGATIGSTPFMSKKQKSETIKYLSDNNLIPDGYRDKDNMYKKHAMGGSIPGAVGFSYARTQSPAPSNGPYAKKTMASAKDGEWLNSYDVAQGGTKVGGGTRDSLAEFKAAIAKSKAAGYGNTLNQAMLSTDKRTQSERETDARLSDKELERKARMRKEILAQGRGQFNSTQDFKDANGAIDTHMRLSLNDNVFDDYINPAAWLGSMANKLGAFPDNINRGNYGQAAMAFAEPLAFGAGEEILAPYISKGLNAGKNFINSKRVLPIVGDYKVPTIAESIGNYKPYVAEAEQGLEPYFSRIGESQIGEYIPHQEDEYIKWFNEQKARMNPSTPVQDPRSILRSSSVIDINDLPNNNFELFDLNNVRKPSGSIGNQGATSEGARDILKSIGIEVESAKPGQPTLKEMVEHLKNNPNDAAKYQKFLEKEPINISELPDGSYQINDGHHRATLSYYSGNENIPTIIKNKGEYIKQRDGGIIKDDRGQWDHPGEITEIGSNDITMEGVPYPVLGISDEGDTKLMKPGKNYKFKGKKVTEFPMAKNGLRQEQKGLVNLDQLTNFTNYNTKQPGGWLDQY